VFEDAQHVEKKRWSSEVHDEENRSDDRACGSDPKSGTHEVELAKEPAGASNERRHTCRGADKKVERNFPRPDWRPNDSLAVIAGQARDGAAGDIDPAARDGSAMFRFLAQSIEAILEILIGAHLLARVAHASRVLIAAFCRDELSCTFRGGSGGILEKVRDGETLSPAREARALPEALT
jgi:hypothetical protein